MKKTFKTSYYYLAGLLLALAVFLSPKTALAAENVPVSQVQDITDVQAVTSTNYQVGKGEYEKLVQFTLAKPAYVYVSAYSTVMLDGAYYNLGSINNFAVYSDAKCSNLVNNDKNQAVWANQKVSKYLCLDAGTYWIYFSKTPGEGDNEGSFGEFRLSVAAQYLNVEAAKNGSWARAKAISTDKKVSGFLSSATRTSWYKFSVAEGTLAKVSVSLDNPMGVREFPLSNTGVTIYKSSHKYITSFNITDKTYYQTAFSSGMTLSAGTYYIEVSGDESYDQWEPTKLNKNEHRNMGGVNLKVTTIKRPSVSSLKNVKGKKAQVTYKAVSGAKGYEIQYSTDSKFKKGAKVVKANAKTTKVTIKNLTKKKKYFVRVRAYKFDDDGNKLTSAWSAAKNVKITK